MMRAPKTVVRLPAALGGALLLAVATAHAAADLSAVPSGTYRSDPTHSYITFRYTHLGLSNPMLTFDDFGVDLNLDNADPTRSTISVTIDPASVVAGSEIWHEQITGPDFFDVANHPEITFESGAIESAGDGAFEVDGTLSIKGESRPVSLAVTINAATDHPVSGEPVIGLSGSTEVLRSEFGMGDLVPAISDEVAIEFTSELVETK